MVAVALARLSLCLVESALGIDLCAGHPLGIWDWYKANLVNGV